jgi:hypothetical protein
MGLQGQLHGMKCQKLMQKSAQQTAQLNQYS